MKRALFITGTDTDVGKTIATGALLLALRQRGVNAASMKPVQTGATREGDLWRAPDLDVHLQAAGLHVDEATYRLMAPYCYEPACSPHLAGRLAGAYPDMEHIAECAHALLAQFDVLLIEGAGGLLAPLDEDHAMLNLIVSLDCPAIVVARTGLGTINHSLLTLSELAAAQVAVPGVLFTQPVPVADAAIELDNPDTVCRLGRTENLGVLKHQPTRDWEQLAQQITGIDLLLEVIA